MKALTLFLSLLFSLPFALSAQSAGEMLQRVSAAIDNKQWEQAISLFRQAVNTNVEKAEMFYWTGVDKNTDVASKFANELASFYKKSRSYDKAYLFYKELLQKSPNDVNCLASCGEMEVCRGSIRLFHFWSFTPKIGCVSVNPIGTLIYSLKTPFPNCRLKSREEFNDILPPVKAIF